MRAKLHSLEAERAEIDADIIALKRLMGDV